MHAAGVPAVEDGAGFVRMIKNGFGDFRDTLARARRDAKALPADDAAAFGELVNEITDAIRTGSRRARETISRARVKYETQELDRAFDRTPECQTIA